MATACALSCRWRADAVFAQRTRLYGAISEIARAVKAIPSKGVILDGELVGLNGCPVTRVSTNSARAKLGCARSQRAANRVARDAVFFMYSTQPLMLFDLLRSRAMTCASSVVNGKEISEGAAPDRPVRYSEHFEKNGEPCTSRS